MPRRPGRAALACGLLPLVASNIYLYNQQTLEPDVIQYRRVGMYAPDDSPTIGPPGNGNSEIKIDVSISRVSTLSAGLIQVLVFHSEHLDNVGYLEPGAQQKTYCCTSTLRKLGVPGCESAGHAIISPGKASEEVWQQDVTFGVNESRSQLLADYRVGKSGVHYLFFSSCDPGTGPVLIDGSTVWMNPYGFLPGELFHLLPFFGVMSLVYLGLGVLWSVLCARYWRELLRLQNCISGVIALGMVETATWYFDYVSFNSTGTRGVGPIVVGVFASTVKKTVSRLLVLVVSLGYGVVRPTLGADGARVVALGVVYFTFSMVLDTVSNISPITDISVPLRLLFILPVALLDAAFYWWIFSGLSRTLSQLLSRKQSAKLTLYRRFSHVLIASIVLSAAWVTWQMVVIISDSLDDRWDTLWIFDAFWHVLYAAILMAIACMWSPSQNNLQYAYSDELLQDDDAEHDDEGDEDGAAAKEAPSEAFSIGGEDADGGTGKCD
ncbi:hypothetical protein KFE25_009128 [Diacronema lutheri]|uniref:GOST seven transmembrane domain-containing protein n=1 Tax=Diacronema lutheri TaxID=2081491 RepID=A0A8J6CD84_DIALT|nr:hypothetical protein KFE25_009128 [Diacronema lutheri]